MTTASTTATTAPVGFWVRAQETPDALAVVDPDGRQINRGELLALSNQIVHAFRDLGLQPGDGIATVLPNSIELFALYLAAMQAGWYCTPINWHLVGPEIAYIVDDAEAKVLVAGDRFAEAAQAAAAELDRSRGTTLLSIGDTPIDGFTPLADALAGHPDTLPADRTAGAPMHYTSGTTGRPKGVRRTLSGQDPDAVVAAGGFLLAMFGIQPEDGHVHICGSPLYHTAVLAFSGTSLHYGHPVVLMDKWDPEEMLRLIDRHRVTHSHMVPTQFHRLLALPDDVRAKYDVSSLRVIIHAAAPCPIETKRRMLEWWGPVIHEYYAATEGGGTKVGPDEWLRKPGTVGKAWPGAEIRIYDEAGNQLGPNQEGTVYMRLPAAGFEYYKDADKTRANRIGDFYTVGDVGVLDDDGYLFLRDRRADMVISGGVNIYPAEIESVLVTHPEVRDAAVFGIPHDDWGEELKAVVEPEDGVEPGPELTERILAFCKGRLAHFKLPRSVDYVAELPRDPNGKLYKRRLRDPYWQGRERAI
jgi:long-chain acyl-CoA synthetase